MTAAPSISRVRVRYAETDAMGIVYHANYLVWFEVGRTDWLRHCGWTYRDMEAEGLHLPVIEVQCAFRRPARYDDELDVHTTACLVSPARVRFAYEVVRPADGVLLASGHTLHAAVDRAGKPTRLPARIRDLLPRHDPPAEGV